MLCQVSLLWPLLLIAELITKRGHEPKGFIRPQNKEEVGENAVREWLCEKFCLSCILRS
jgi:hypothetical protein